MIIRPVAPFRLDLTVWALRRRGRNTIDRWDGTTYRRVVVIEGRPTLGLGPAGLRRLRKAVAPWRPYVGLMYFYCSTVCRTLECWSL